jgi:transcription antitermination factor NusB
VDRRTKARELAMQSLFQLDVQGDHFLDQMNRFIREQGEDDMTSTMAFDWTAGAWDNVSVCDGLITTAAGKWDLSRLSSVDRSILRLGAYQLKFCPDIPGKVVINEAIEIAKKYSGAQSPRFVNGVLDAILKRMKEEA